MKDQTIPIDTEYSVVVRILPQGEEVELELPAASTGKTIKDSLLDHPELNIPKTDPEGNRYHFKLISKSAGKEISDDKTLYECGVNNGDTLLMTPTLVAG